MIVNKENINNLLMFYILCYLMFYDILSCALIIIWQKEVTNNELLEHGRSNLGCINHLHGDWMSGEEDNYKP